MKIKTVYLVGNREHGKFKIGITTDLDKRLSSLSTGAPFKLETIYTWPHQEYRRLEKHLHEQFRKKRVKGEWFELSNDDLLRCPVLVGDFNEVHPQKFEEFAMPEQVRPRFNSCTAIGHLFDRKVHLLEELDEVDFLLKAVGKYIKPLSEKKRKQLKNATAARMAKATDARSIT